ncbi:uroporphyrinogen decarboxylase [Labilibacter sediminis]|nr:uroporphyrinogen decarboxylase [Labilibacter sediminis]
MNKKQLFNRLINNEKSDITSFHPLWMHFAARFIGKTYGEFASDYKTLVKSNIKAMEYFDADMVGLVSDPYRETAAFGAKVTFPAEEVPRCQKLIVNSIEDANALKNPDVYKNERTLDRIKGAELYQKELKGEVPVIGWIEGPLAEACDLTGLSNMLLQLMMDPDFSNTLLDKCMVTAKDFAEAQITAGCDIIGMGDAICSQIDASTYDTYVKERHREIIDFIHEKGAKVKLHICGDITHILPSLADLPIDILDIDHMVDLQSSYEILGPEIIRCGNIDPVFVMNKSSEEVENACKEMVQKEKGRKFILSAGCEICLDTSIKNLQAMRTASL